MDGRRFEDISPRSVFVRATKILNRYGSQLRSLSKRVGDILRGHDVSTPHGAERAAKAIRRYEAGIGPWAEAAANHMVAETAARDERSWFRVARSMGRSLKKEIAEAPIGGVMQGLQREQVSLIRSIPAEAADRVQRLAREAVSDGTRADALAAEIMRTEGVSRSKATLIARTETGRANTLLTQARAEHVGSTHFQWSTVGDSDVRATHKALNGKVFSWNDPPVCDDPDIRALPGCVFNCRCVAIPIID